MAAALVAKSKNVHKFALNQQSSTSKISFSTNFDMLFNLK